MYKILVSFFFCSTLWANEWQDLERFLPPGTQLSYLVVDAATQKTVVSHHANTLRTPASVQKVLTALAAKIYLGDDFRFETSIRGSRDKISLGNYQGSLSFQFVGDPTLLRVDIRKMLLRLKSLGIKNIKGDFLLNSHAFNGYQWSNGQAWNDLGVCYTAPSHAIIVNKNCVLGNLGRGDGKTASLFIPPYEPMRISSDVQIVSVEEKQKAFCDLEITRHENNRYHLWGCMVPRSGAFPLAFAVNDPFNYAAEIIRSELKRVGIKLTGQVREDSAYLVSDKLVTHQSITLDRLLLQMLKNSDNLIADSLFKTLGAHYFNTSGNFRNGALALKLILEKQGIDLGNSYIVDGSGLSRHNLMSSKLFMKVLNYIYKHDKTLHILASFPIAGKDGTLKYHRGVHDTLLTEKVIAKTGSMKGVSNLLGRVSTARGDMLFVVLLNAYVPLKSASVSVLVSKDHFQREFLKRIVLLGND
ncbi:D-alanyl-D-alanine carboxypeptidase/D-alanyl-D-alanine-endopeptidase [Psychromonas sp. CNPT3]|uniref:D-alanyl-D-alanine carboxypeptidase/D-alanyl-D-alanine endopeptidase n=1 Tax=Psychromonas sp. CNPT3 TaxID=314282 RepID=UPI00006E5883|nr:D-alanyl-D-alanine carboxypeptidase/D-alanyl-D-alanine-endopeptidase [Psychromonas sp. CNPT3]AGH80412.1 D-alanyl-D-alanine carboxypeptidase/D-alanyl-D-alanine-endopeptidase [Psychromonas sp. CNPT3]